MPFSHHSHSGQFCNHASDKLEEVIQKAVGQRMQVFALTEHMPRNLEEDLYPGEAETGYDLKGQAKIFRDFYTAARRLQAEYDNRISLLVGMEIDWIRASSKDWIEHLLSSYQLDLFVGSVHHVHGIPIDFTAEMYAKALTFSSARKPSDILSMEEILFMDYFDAQLELVTALRPPVVGHFDLIRLLSRDPNRNLQSSPSVWKKIERNLRAIRSYGGALELNSSGLRKGLKEPYPKLEVCKRFQDLGGIFVFSDDSHGAKQVGHSYLGLLFHAEAAGIESIALFQRGLPTADARFPDVGVKFVPIKEVREHAFWEKTAA